MLIGQLLFLANITVTFCYSDKLLPLKHMAMFMATSIVIQIKNYVEEPYEVSSCEKYHQSSKSHNVIIKTLSCNFFRIYNALNFQHM